MPTQTVLAWQCIEDFHGFAFQYTTNSKGDLGTFLESELSSILVEADYQYLRLSSHLHHNHGGFLNNGATEKPHRSSKEIYLEMCCWNLF